MKELEGDVNGGREDQVPPHERVKYLDGATSGAENVPDKIDHHSHLVLRRIRGEELLQVPSDEARWEPEEGVQIDEKDCEDLRAAQEDEVGRDRKDSAR